MDSTISLESRQFTTFNTSARPIFIDLAGGGTGCDGRTSVPNCLQKYKHFPIPQAFSEINPKKFSTTFKQLLFKLIYDKVICSLEQFHYLCGFENYSHRDLMNQVVVQLRTLIKYRTTLGQQNRHIGNIQLSCHRKTTGRDKGQERQERFSWVSNKKREAQWPL